MTGKKGSSPESIVQEIKRLSADVSKIIIRDGIHSLRNQHANRKTSDNIHGFPRKLLTYQAY